MSFRKGYILLNYHAFFNQNKNILLELALRNKIFCKITENGETVFEIRTLAGSSEHAKNIVDNWKANATEIYPKIMKALNGEE